MPASCSWVSCFQKASIVSRLRARPIHRTSWLSRSLTIVKYLCRLRIDFSSIPMNRTTRFWRRAIPRATARIMIPSTSSQLIRIRRTTASNESSRNQAITHCSKSAVKPLRSSAHGTAICLTPCISQSMRGTSAVMKSWYWQKSKCRQRRDRVSYLPAASPHTGQVAGPSCVTRTSTIC